MDQRRDQRRIGRRRFLEVTAGAAAAAGLTLGWGACDDDAGLDAAVPTRVAGYRGLAELPWFELDGDGVLRCTAPDLQSIDFHVHLGLSYLLSPEIDLQRRTAVTRYLIDCDGAEPPCALDLDPYQNACASPEMVEAMQAELTASGLPSGSEAARTHTIPNLLAEMDAMGTRQAVLLPIAMNLSVKDDATERWLEAIATAGASERLIPFGSVHPQDDEAASKLARYKGLGIKGVKLHPVTQRFFPDDERAMAVYQACEALELPVLLHAGRSGIEPEFMRKYGVLERYQRPIADFPGVRFVLGHAGCAMDFAAALELAKGHDNVWLELSGRGLPSLESLVAELPAERLIFGSDWPFYPEAPMLAKVLMLTQHDRSLRAQLLHRSAEAFLAGG